MEKDSLVDDDVENWDVMIDGNVKGLLYVSKMVIPRMVERKSGHIINISSVAGKEKPMKMGWYIARLKDLLNLLVRV